MSLTSLLNTSAVRERFREAFEKPVMEGTPPMQAPVITERPSHLGTAFDYLLRFYVRRQNPSTVTGRTWVAEAATERLSDAQHEAAQDTIRRARAARDAYVASGTLTEAVLEAVLHLARLDLVARSTVDITTVDPIREHDIKDLRQLHDVVPPYAFQSDEQCLLNPTFGKASRLVGGADADLLLDDTLIDIKTVKEATFTRSMFNQLLGYYTLHVIDGIGGMEPKPTIRRVGVYFARHAHLHTVNLDTVIDRSTYPDFVEWFAMCCMEGLAGGIE